MRTTFEQPKHLNAFCYRRLLRVLQPALIVYALLMTALLLTALWRRAKAGEHITPLSWLFAATFGIWAAGLVRLMLRVDVSRRLYIEFREKGLLLDRRGVVALRRIKSWSLVPDPDEPRYTRLQITYKYGLGRKRWSMLLDDDDQVAELKDALTAHIPQTNAV